MTRLGAASEPGQAKGPHEHPRISSQSGAAGIRRPGAGRARRLLDRKGGVPARHRDAEFPQHRFGLIFVDVHADLLPAPAPMQHLIVSYLASLTALLHVIRTSSVPRFARDMS